MVASSSHRGRESRAWELCPSGCFAPILNVQSRCHCLRCLTSSVAAADSRELRVRRLLSSEMFYLEQLCSVFDVYADPLRYPFFVSLTV